MTCSTSGSQNKEEEEITIRGETPRDAARATVKALNDKAVKGFVIVQCADNPVTVLP